MALTPANAPTYPMALDVLHQHPPLIPDVHGGLPGVISIIEAWKYRDGFINIKMFDFDVKVVNFLLFISVHFRTLILHRNRYLLPFILSLVLFSEPCNKN